MRSTTRVALATTGLTVLSACSSDPPTTSTFTGRLAVDTFEAPVHQVTVVDSAGARSAVSVDAKGSFQLVLGKGHFRVFLSDDGKAIPLVVKTDDAGRLETELSVKTGGASVDMGMIRFWAGVTTTKSARGLPTTPAPVANGACVNGIFEGSGVPCASGNAKVACSEEVDEDDDEGEHEHEGEGDDDQPGQDQTASDATPDEALAVVQFNVGEDIGCGEHEDGDEEEEDGD